jgi:hypothetical protein
MADRTEHADLSSLVGSQANHHHPAYYRRICRTGRTPAEDRSPCCDRAIPARPGYLRSGAISGLLVLCGLLCGSLAPALARKPAAAASTGCALIGSFAARLLTLRPYGLDAAPIPT